MYNKITSTELKKNTREVLREVCRNKYPTVIYTYNEPIAIITKYDTQENNIDIKPEVSLWEKVKDYICDGPEIDSTAIIRGMRDAE